ncbi:MAG: hypothetical protein NTY11_00760 [Candidatus Parcubacteria bacterium]|nr:hypothetical protein [Candidatus Parcubacteria bacterium]
MEQNLMALPLNKKLKDIRERIEGITDKLGKPIEQGIKETVVMLNAFDIKTSQSCEGHFEEDQKTAPWVLIHPEEPQTDGWWGDEGLREKVVKESQGMRKKSMDLLAEFYKDRKVPYDAIIGFKGVGYGFKIQSIGADIFETLDPKGQQEKLSAYKKEMGEFTAFLGKKYQGRMHAEEIGK